MSSESPGLPWSRCTATGPVVVSPAAAVQPRDDGRGGDGGEMKRRTAESIDLRSLNPLRTAHILPVSKVASAASCGRFSNGGFPRPNASVPAYNRTLGTRFRHLVRRSFLRSVR
jgi:hypothetical protein